TALYSSSLLFCLNRGSLQQFFTVLFKQQLFTAVFTQLFTSDLYCSVLTAALYSSSLLFCLNSSSLQQFLLFKLFKQRLFTEVLYCAV
uniref:Uncharacterized protein n=1 Tax=Hucho hucho TaxID=62062 RepID=A0A4W5QUR1_9TELE